MRNRGGLGPASGKPPLAKRERLPSRAIWRSKLATQQGSTGGAAPTALHALAMRASPPPVERPTETVTWPPGPEAEETVGLTARSAMR
jgi:hypothetical protein